MRIALGIEYDGSAFCGWQVQPDMPTVQETLESALKAFAIVPISTVCAGRTDTGVHATHQVVDFEAPVNRPLPSWIRGVNTFLPAGVAVRWAKEVPDDFSARFSATERIYEYWIYNHPVRSPLMQARAGWVFRPCDEEKMFEASRCLLGEHDFTSFRASECQAKSPVRTMHEVSIKRAGSLIGIRLRANAFLHHMVRNIVGSLVYVGTGRESVSWFEDVFNAKDRTLAAPTFAASGLYLVGVRYPAAPDLPFYSPTAWSEGVFGYPDETKIA